RLPALQAAAARPDRDRTGRRLPARRAVRVTGGYVSPVRSRLLPLLIVLMAAVLLTLGLPLAASVAAAEQQRLVIDRIDDTARFAALAQAITDTSPDSEERRRTLQTDLEVYTSVYDIRAGVFFRDDRALAKAPSFWSLPAEGEGRTAFDEAL